jgi:PAS domain S-box-containing protein
MSRPADPAPQLTDEERFRDLFENANDVFYTLDLESRITGLNRRAEVVLGYTREEAIGKSAADIVPTEYRPLMQEALRQKLAGGESPTVYEIEMVRKDGNRVRLEVSSRLIVRDGVPVGVQGVARDITDRKRAEQAVLEREAELRATREQLQLITDNMSAPITRCSRDLRYVWVSKPYARWLGRPPEEIAGRLIVDVIGAEGLASIQRYIDRVLAGEQVRYEDVVNFRGLGQRWLRAVYTPTLDAAGTPDGWVAVVDDVTEQKRAEEALRQADRRKDEFLAILAHELRNPLAPIRNALHYLQLRHDDEKGVERVREIMNRQVSHLTRLIDDLLDLSRINRGKLVLKPEKVDLARLTLITSEDQRPAMEAAGLQLDLQLPQTPVWTSADPTRLNQILDNLLENARKFTDPGGRVTVRLSVGTDHAEAMLSVCDTGIGIESARLPGVFDVFSHADRNLDRSRGGLGLGLAIVRGLVELHRGRIEVHSEGRGQGTEFVIRLPLQVSDAPMEARVDSPNPRARGLRVLIIEDHRDVAESLRMVLELCGCHVWVAFCGREGLELAQRLKPDVAVCDLGLPGMDGFAIASALRQDPATASVRLIAVSGYGQEQDRRRAKEAGFDEHFTKPVDPKELLARLEGA